MNIITGSENTLIQKLIKLAGLGTFGVVILLWLATGIYTVDSGEEAVVLRFGQHVKTVKDSGLKWHIPSPIETVWKANTSQVNRLEFGFRTVQGGDKNQNAQYQDVLAESIMITSDENLVDIEAIIQFKVIDVEEFFFNVDDPIQTLRLASESSIRRIVANHILDDALTDNKISIQQEIQTKVQEIINIYGLGIKVTDAKLQDVDPPSQVKEAFDDVQKAKEDQITYIKQAESYANQIIPEARGKAAEMLNAAEAFKEKRIAEAQGDVAKFNEMLTTYKLGKEVTRTRLYLEMMEDVLPEVKKYITDGSGDTVQFLPLGPNTVIPQKNN